MTIEGYSFGVTPADGDITIIDDEPLITSVTVRSRAVTVVVDVVCP